jgi:hypothetical protein
MRKSLAIWEPMIKGVFNADWPGIGQYSMRKARRSERKTKDIGNVNLTMED